MSFAGRRLPAPAALVLVLVAVPQVGASPRVWVIDDGEKLKEEVDDAPLSRGEGNPVWAPGEPVRLVALRDETVALQVVIEADAAPLAEVTVELDGLGGPAGVRLENAPEALDPARPLGRRIERFVEHFVEVPRPSGGRSPGESLGWDRGAGPAPGAYTGRLPDALIPVELAPSWRPYPLAIAPHRRGIVWIDLYVPRGQPPGPYRGVVRVRAGGRELARLPLELELRDAVLPARPIRTMLYYDREELDRRIGAGEAAERQLWQLLHRHRVAPMHHGRKLEELARRLPALDGSLYTAAAGYEGPGESLGDGVLALGAYGMFRAPDERKRAEVERIADWLVAKRLDRLTDTFVYAVDEDCASPWGADWKRLLTESRNANLKALRVAWTCSEAPRRQPVDVVMQLAAFDPIEARDARARGQELWQYNGSLPRTGTFLLDAPAVSPRVNGWLQATHDVGRWFYWEASFWYDDNRGGHGPYDPFTTAETFHNGHGDWAMGDGVLVYPGRQVDGFAERSAGFAGVFSSIRLKNWRRGIEDAGYYQLARAAQPARAEAIARALLPAAFSSARPGRRPAWSDRGAPFYRARRALAALIPAGTDGGAGVGARPRVITGGGGESFTRARGCGRLGCSAAPTAGDGGWTLAIGLILTVLARRHRLRRQRAR